MREKELLPMGSVVGLKGSKKRVMITGFSSKVKEKVFDYCGCLFPEGIIDSNMNILFNNEDIEKIYYKCSLKEEIKK